MKNINGWKKTKFLGQPTYTKDKIRYILLKSKNLKFKYEIMKYRLYKGRFMEDINFIDSYRKGLHTNKISTFEFKFIK